MLIYEIIANVRPDLVERYELYMREIHIPDLMATGFFSAARFLRSGDRHRIQYETDDLEGYLAKDAGRLRVDFLAHFPEGITVERETWEVVEVWADSL